MLFFFFFKQKTAYEMRISDWSSDVCSSDLLARQEGRARYAEVVFRKPHRHVEREPRGHHRAHRRCLAERDPPARLDRERLGLLALPRHAHAARHRPRDPPPMRAVMLYEPEPFTRAVAHADLLDERAARARTSLQQPTTANVEGNILHN